MDSRMSPQSTPIGVVMMAYGTPASPEDVLAYYTHIRRGNPPTPELLEDLSRRYNAIGGISPLREKTQAQGTAIATFLDEQHPGKFRITLGQKHAEPFIEDAVETLREVGCTQFIGFVLAPHFSEFSVGQYEKRFVASVNEHATSTDIHTAMIQSWYALTAYQTFLANQVRTAVSQSPGNTFVLFTAHSLPEKLLINDPYPDQLSEGAQQIAELAGVPAGSWGICWQSAGRTADAWRGPDILEVIQQLALNDNGIDSIVVCPHGFVADHLEVLFDIDIEAMAVAKSVNISLIRTPVVNDEQSVMHALGNNILSIAQKHSFM